MENIEPFTVKLIEVFAMVTSGFINDLTCQAGSILKKNQVVSQLSSIWKMSFTPNPLLLGKNKNEHQIITIKKGFIKLRNRG